MTVEQEIATADVLANYWLNSIEIADSDGMQTAKPENNLEMNAAQVLYERVTRNGTDFWLANAACAGFNAGLSFAIAVRDALNVNEGTLRKALAELDEALAEYTAYDKKSRAA